MAFIATKDNVIFKVRKKKINPDELLIEVQEEKEPILLGTIVASGPNVHEKVKETKGTLCAYKSRVAILPWGTDDEEFYVVKEENIYGILE